MASFCDDLDCVIVVGLLLFRVGRANACSSRFQIEVGQTGLFKLETKILTLDYIQGIEIALERRGISFLK